MEKSSQESFWLNLDGDSKNNTQLIVSLQESMNIQYEEVKKVDLNDCKSGKIQILTEFSGTEEVSALPDTVEASSIEYDEYVCCSSRQ